jgi:hypothetical protein
MSARLKLTHGGANIRLQVLHGFRGQQDIETLSG